MHGHTESPWPVMKAGAFRGVHQSVPWFLSCGVSQSLGNNAQVYNHRLPDSSICFGEYRSKVTVGTIFAVFENLTAFFGDTS